MAGQVTGFQMAYKIAASNQNPDNSNVNEIPRYRLVELAGEGEVRLPTADNVLIKGVVCNDERLQDPLRGGNGSLTVAGSSGQAGKHIAVQLDRIGSVELAGTVTAGQRLTAKAGGKAVVMPSAAGVYNVIGYAEKDGVAGDVIPYHIDLHTYTVVTP
jgi:hypothetical protein